MTNEDNNNGRAHEKIMNTNGKRIIGETRAKGKGLVGGGAGGRCGQSYSK